MEVCFVLERLRIGLVIGALVLSAGLGRAADTKKKDQAAPTQSSAAPTQSTTEEASWQYVGSQTCQGCHDQIYTQFEASPHGLTLQKTKVAPEGHGCESCHGPGSAHVEGGGDKTKIFGFKKVSVDSINERCQNCHQQNLERANWSRSPHATNGVACTSCHSPHHAKSEQALLVERTPQLCYNCHNDQRADFAKPYRHRVNEGLIQCSDCHNPHGAFITRRSLRSTESEEEVCFNCHRDKQGPFLFEHPPVRTEGCTSCHTPHGSANPRLLRVAPVNVLCLQCHTPGMNQSAPGTPSGPVHNQTLKYASCTLCHPAIHGSNSMETFEQ